jgi:hypothetical protein
MRPLANADVAPFVAAYHKAVAALYPNGPASDAIILHPQRSPLQPTKEHGGQRRFASEASQ